VGSAIVDQIVSVIVGPLSGIKAIQNAGLINDAESLRGEPYLGSYYFDGIEWEYDWRISVCLIEQELAAFPGHIVREYIRLKIIIPLNNVFKITQIRRGKHINR
jgi:hypothetical protein